MLKFKYGSGGQQMTIVMVEPWVLCKELETVPFSLFCPVMWHSQHPLGGRHLPPNSRPALALWAQTSLLQTSVRLSVYKFPPLYWTAIAIDCGKLTSTKDSGFNPLISNVYNIRDQQEGSRRVHWRSLKPQAKVQEEILPRTNSGNALRTPEHWGGHQQSLRVPVGI